KETMALMPVPAKYKVAPQGTPEGQPYNVAQAYARGEDALRGRGSFDVDFNLAVERHKLIDAIERSSATGRSASVLCKRICQSLRSGCGRRGAGPSLHQHSDDLERHRREPASPLGPVSIGVNRHRRSGP